MTDLQGHETLIKYDPRNEPNDMSGINHRNGRLEAALRIALADFRWISTRRESSKIMIHSASQRLLVERTPAAIDNFETAMLKHHEIGSRIGASISHLEKVIEEMDAGKIEEQRRRDEYRANIVKESAMRGKPLPISTGARR